MLRGADVSDEMSNWSDEDLVEMAGDGIGQEPAGRPRAQAELMRRHMMATRRLTVEMESSNRTMGRLTSGLYWLTAAIAAMTLVLVIIELAS